LIKVKGVQVAPAELESLLLDHPQVADAAVVGIKRSVIRLSRAATTLISNSDEDEVSRAYIVLKSPSSVTAKDIMDYMDVKVSKIKRLSGGIVFTNSIPKNPVCVPRPPHCVEADRTSPVKSSAGF
jgi:4-coumarate--CoA ligase